MKLSLSLAQQLATDIDLAGIPKQELQEKIGSQLAAIEDSKDYSLNYEGAVVVKIVSCEKHPEADKLSICMIDDGKKNDSVARNDQGLIQVVCGAPNVASEKFAIWLAPGVTVPASRQKSEPFVLEMRQIRGQNSSGMLASSSELGISDDHSGLLLINPEEIGRQPILGEPLVGLFGLNDLVIELENKMFTHRPDCFGVLGLARELAGITGQSFSSPDWYKLLPKPREISSENKLDLELENRLPELVPRFMLMSINNVKIGPSPIWLQVILSRYNIRPINNVVDVTNYMMLLSGQPTHAYDYHKLAKLSGDKVKIVVRPAEKSEKLQLLNGKTIELEPSTMLIATDKAPIGLAGIMGGSETEVDNGTTAIVIECGSFDMYSVRKASMHHGITTEASTRFSKGQSSWQNAAVISKTVDMILEIAGGQVASDYIESPAPGILDHIEVLVGANFINSRLGINLSAAKITELLKNVEFSVLQENDLLKITVPFWRTDIEIAEDIVEEVGRLYGYDNLPHSLPQKDLAASPKNQLLELKDRIRVWLQQAGANEILTHSFIHDELMSKVGQDQQQAYHIRNALSPDLQRYRVSMTPSLLNKVHQNIKNGYLEFAIYELGKVHTKLAVDEQKLPIEFERLALVFTADDRLTNKKLSSSSYYQAKYFLEFLAEKLNILDLEFELMTDNLESVWELAAKPFEPLTSAAVYHQKKLIGLVGEPNASVKKALKLPKFTSMFELDLTKLLELSQLTGNYSPLSRFPSLWQDICLKIDDIISYQQLYQFIVIFLNERTKNTTIETSVSQLDIFKAEHSDRRQITFRVEFTNNQSTMTDQQVSAILDQLATKATEQLNAERI